MIGRSSFLSLYFFAIQTLISQTADGRRIKSKPTSVVDPRCGTKNWLRHVAYLFRNFTGAKVRNLVSIFNPSRLALWFRHIVTFDFLSHTNTVTYLLTYRKFKTRIMSGDDWLTSYSDISPITSLIFTEVKKSENWPRFWNPRHSGFEKSNISEIQKVLGRLLWSYVLPKFGAVQSTPTLKTNPYKFILKNGLKKFVKSSITQLQIVWYCLNLIYGCTAGPGRFRNC